MKLGIDLDGVLANFNDAFADILRGINPNITLPQASKLWPAVWDWPKVAGYTSKQVSEAWEIVKTTTFWGTLHPLKGTPEVLKELSVLRGIGHEVYFITTRPGRMAKYYSEIWLGAHGMQNPTVIISEDKGSISRGLGLDVFVDDRAENVLDVLDASVDCYIIDYAYNRSLTNMYVNRVNNVQEVLDKFFPELATLKEVA